jgi:hypothetical protein
MDLKTLVGSITIATTGLTACNNTGGAVDPAPPPLQCLDASKPLYASGYLQGMTIHVEVSSLQAASELTYSEWIGMTSVFAVTGGTLISVTNGSGGNLDIAIDLPALPASGSFTVQGTIQIGSTTCAVEQTFTFVTTGDAGAVKVSALDDVLPLRSRVPATIVVLNQRERALELRPDGASAGSRVTWTATAGSVAVQSDGGATWRLPDEPGVYQIELLVERGDEGLALDTLTLEVT